MTPIASSILCNYSKTRSKRVESFHVISLLQHTTDSPGMLEHPSQGELSGLPFPNHGIPSSQMLEVSDL